VERVVRGRASSEAAEVAHKQGAGSRRGRCGPCQVSLHLAGGRHVSVRGVPQPSLKGARCLQGIFYV
jgi:hypothetical protein